MATLVQPFLDKQKYFRIIVALYDAMAEDYNAKVKEERKEGDYSRNTLKSAHRALYLQLINIAAAELSTSLDLFRETDGFICQRDSRSSVIISTNRVSLSNRLHCSEATAYRLVRRLLDTGILSGKVHHGNNRSFDLKLNPDMLPLSDEFDANYEPLSDIYAHTDNQVLRSSLRSICTHIDINKNFYNNRIIPEHQKASAVQPIISKNKQEQITGTPKAKQNPLTIEERFLILRGENPKIDEYKKEIMEQLCRSDARCAQNDASKGIQQVKEVKVVATKIDEQPKPTTYQEKLAALNDRIEARRKRFAMALVNIVLQVLFKDKNIYTGEVEKAYAVAEFYFQDAAQMSNKACEVKLSEYKQRVEMVERWKVRQAGRNGWSWDNIYPAAYLHPENYTSGFIMTEKWLKKSKDYAKFKEFRQLKNNEAALLQGQLDRLAKYRNPWTYNQCCIYMQKYAPAKLSTFKDLAIPVLNNTAN